MGGGQSAPSKQLAKSFGSDHQARRGPTLGTLLFPGPEAGSWRVLAVTPLRVEVFDGHDATAVELEADLLAALNQHAPFTACAARQDAPQDLAIGCQDGTVLILEVLEGRLRGPRLRLNRVDEASAQSVAADTGLQQSLAMSITALHLSGTGAVFAGSCGSLFCWHLQSGELQREFQLPGGATAGAVVAVQDEEGSQNMLLWVGLDTGSLAIFEASSGMLVRSFSCSGPEAVVCLAYSHRSRAVFTLSAHKRVSIWDSTNYSCLQRYAADLMTCGTDLSSMASASLQELELELLLLAGVDGSLCVRRIKRREDRKMNCVLLWYMENASGEGCPLTSLSYHAGTDSVLLGTAACQVQLLAELRNQLGSTVEMAEPKSKQTARAADNAGPGQSPNDDCSESPGASTVARRGDSGTLAPGESLAAAAGGSAGLPDSTPAPGFQPAAEGTEEAELPSQDGYPGDSVSRDGYPGESGDQAAFPVFSGG